jgi:hypothetical protein
VFVCCVCFLGFHNLFNFAAEEDAMTMIVQLGVVCTGNVRVTEDLKKWAKLCTVAKHIFNSIRSTLAK